VNRRKATRRPSRTHAAIEPLEPRAMLAGLAQDSLGGLGSITAVLLPGVSSPPGIVFNGGSPTLGSTAGTGGSQSNGPVLFSGTGSGTHSTPSGTGGSSTPNGPVLLSGTGSGTGSSTGGSGSSTPNGPVLFGGTGSGTGSSTSGSGSSTPNGPVLFGGSGSGTGSTTSTTGGSPDPNSPVLLSQYTGGSNAGTQGTGTNNGGTLSGSDLWLLYGAGLGAGSSSSGASGGSSSNLLTLLSQYQEGSSASGQGNGTGNTLSNADLWGMYWSGAGAGSSSSGSDEGSLADDPTISAQYTGGSGVGRITPLVYNPESDGPPVFVSGVWTGDAGGWQYVNASDGEGIPPTKPDTATASVGWFDWYRNLWRSEAKPVTPQVDQPRGADIPALGLPDQLPATRPDGTIDPVFNNTVEKAAPISAAGLKGVDLEEYVRKRMGGSGNFKAPNGRDIDGMLPDGRWYEVKSAFNYLFRNGALDPRNWNAFTSQISSAAAEAAKQGKSFVLLTNITPPAEVVAWLAKRGIPWELVK